LRYTAGVPWQTLKKTPVALYVEFGDFSNNLSATNVQINTTERLTEIRIDLNRNLGKTGFGAIDAEALAKGKLSRLKAVHLSDGTVIKRIEGMGLDFSRTWEMIIELNGSNRFAVTPGITAGSLVLSVVPPG
jgi:hypothetical protein